MADNLYLANTAVAGNYASTPDNAAFSALGNFSVAILVALDDWTPAGLQTLVCHRDVNSRSWLIGLPGSSNGLLNVQLSLTTTTTDTNVNTSAAPPFTDKVPYWILVTRNSSTGVITVYTAPYVAGTNTPPAIGSFTQLGTTLTGVTGTLANSTSVLEVCSTNIGGAGNLAARVWRVLVYTGIYGSSPTLVRNFNPSDAASRSSTSWTAGTTGETWTVNGTGKLASERALDGKAPTSSSTKAATRVAKRLAAKAATASSARATALRRPRPLAGKAATASSARATVVRRARALVGRAGTSSSARASAFVRARSLVGKAPTSSSARAGIVARARRLVARVPTASSATGTRLARLRRLVARAPTATSARANLTVSGAAVVAFAGKSSTASSARATAFVRVRRLVVRVPTSTSARAVTVARLRPFVVRSATSTSARAGLTVALRVGGELMRWTGTQWIAEPVYVWNGTAWVPKPVRRWTGTEWVAA